MHVIDIHMLLISEQRVYVQGGAASPFHLIRALIARGQKDNLKEIEVIHAPTQLDCEFSNPENEGNIVYSHSWTVNSVILKMKVT